MRTGTKPLSRYWRFWRVFRIGWSEVTLQTDEPLGRLKPSQFDQEEIFMTDKYVPALRQQFLEDMQIKGLRPKTQTMYLRWIRYFTRFMVRSPDTATPEDLQAFQLDMKERSVGAPAFNNRLTVLRFFFAETCPRPGMKTRMNYLRAAKKIPIVLSAEEVVRILEVAPGPA